MNIYDLIQQCMMGHGTNAFYCAKTVHNIVPLKNYENSFNKNIVNFSFLSMNVYTNIEFIDDDLYGASAVVTNDDINFYLKKLMHYFVEKEYIHRDYNLSYNKTNQSLIAVCKALDNKKRKELKLFFNEMPNSFNSRVLTYIS